MSDGQIAAVTAIVTAICTAVPILYGQYLAHTRAMREMDVQREAAEARATEARKALSAKVDSVEAKVVNVQAKAEEAAASTLEVKEGQRVFMDYLETGTFQAGKLSGIREERARSGFGKLDGGTDR